MRKHFRALNFACAGPAAKIEPATLTLTVALRYYAPRLSYDEQKLSFFARAARCDLRRFGDGPL